MPNMRLAGKGLPPFAINFILSYHSIPDEDMAFFAEAKDERGLREAITKYYGTRCQEDCSSYIRTPDQGICACCEAWRAFDRMTGVVYPAAVIEGL